MDSTDLRADENRCSSSHSRCWFAGCRLQGVYTERSSDRPVGPTGLSDWSVRRSYRVNASFDRSDRRSKNQTCLISSDCRSDCRSMWTLRPTGRTDRPVGRPITLQRWRYYNQLTGHIDLIDIMWAVRLQSVQPVCPTGLTDSRT